MVFGMSLATYTLLHVVISLLGIGSGLTVVFGLIGGKRLDGLTAFLLATTAFTSLTGYGFPFELLLPSHIVGGISLAVLALAIFARYSQQMVGKWRATYVATAVVALFLNVFVLVVQSFLKVAALEAPDADRGAFPDCAARGHGFIVLGMRAVKKFREDPARALRAA